MYPLPIALVGSYTLMTIHVMYVVYLHTYIYPTYLHSYIHLPLHYICMYITYICVD